MRRDIVVVGASTGGVSALQDFARQLPRNWEAACMIVLHIASHSRNFMPAILQKVTALPVLSPQDFMPLRQGQIYVAPPNYHLILEGTHLRVWHGPKENGHRPAVDTLFRSAAQVYGPRVIGVVLTGSLDCGTQGLREIKKHQGIAVVQDPADAEDPSMPLSALEHVQVDHIAKLSEMGNILTQLTQEELSPIPPAIQLPEEPRLSPSTLICPECGGPLWEDEKKDFSHYECRTGHQFSPDSLFAAKTEELDTALWHALEILREKAKLARGLAKQAVLFKHAKLSIDFNKEAMDADNCAVAIEKLLMGSQIRRPDKLKKEA